MDRAALASMIDPLVWREQGPDLTFAEPEMGVVYQVLEFGQWTGQPFQLTIIDGNHSKQSITFHGDRPDAVRAANDDHVRRILSSFRKPADTVDKDAPAADGERAPTA